VTFIDFVRLTRTNVWTLVVLTLLGAVAAFGYARTLPVVYQADSTGYVTVGDPAQQTTGDVVAGNTLAATKAESFLPLVSGRAVAARAIEIMGTTGTDSPAGVAGRVSGSVAANSNILTVTATGPTPASATALADAVIQATSEEANVLELGGTANPGATPLVKIIQIDSALPGVRISPNLPKYTLAGALGGLALAYALVFLRRLMDTKVRSVKDVEEQAEATVVGIVPMTPELRAATGRGRIDRLGGAAEAFRQLRTNLRFVQVDQPPRSIVVTSANAGEGKSTISAVLARILGEAGQPTVIIDADLRRPVLAQLFDTSGRVGLSQVLAGQVTLAEALVATDQPDVLFLPAGRTPPNPSELLGSQRMRALIAELAEDRLVILDAPPLLPVTDAGLLTAMSDGALLVLAVGKTHKEQARLCAKVVDQVGGTILGTVLNMAPRKGMGAVVYGYGYGTYRSEYYSSKAYHGRRRTKRSLLGNRGGSSPSSETIDA